MYRRMVQSMIERSFENALYVIKDKKGKIVDAVKYPLEALSYVTNKDYEVFYRRYNGKGKDRNITQELREVYKV